jgi:hypothetical protein
MSSFVLHLNAPLTQAPNIKGPKILVNHPKLRPCPHKKCLVNTKLGASKVYPTIEISSMSY